MVEPAALRRAWRRIAGAAVLLLLAVVAPAAAACTLSSAVSADLGSYSSPAIQQGVVPALRSRGGLSCDPSLLTLLGGNYIRARLTSENGFKLLRSDGPGSIGYTASADPGGTVPFVGSTSVNYMQNNLLNLLGLLGGSSADLPFFIKPTAAATLPLGTYTDRVTIAWSWYLCPGGISLAGLCIGGANRGTGSSVVDVAITVTRRDVVVALTMVATWDPDNGTRRPRAVPASRGRVALTVNNPDLVPLDPGTLAIVLPRPEGTTVALDGDGTGNPAMIATADGATPSSLSVRYAAPADATDDVDFSADAGMSWSHLPAPDDPAVTHVRIRPRGTMAPQSTFTVSVPYRVR